MKTKPMFILAMAFAALAFICLPLSLRAQVGAAPATVSATIAAPAAADSSAVTADSIVQWLTPLLVPLIIAGAKKIMPDIPSWALPIIAPVLGVILGIIQNVATGHASNLAVAALLGLAGVGVRELKDQLTPAPTGGSATS